MDPIVEQFVDLSAEAEVLELLANTLKSICAGRRRDLVPAAAKHEAIIRKKLEAVTVKMNGAKVPA